MEWDLGNQEAVRAPKRSFSLNIASQKSIGDWRFVPVEDPWVVPPQIRSLLLNSFIQLDQNSKKFLIDSLIVRCQYIITSLIMKKNNQYCLQFKLVLMRFFNSWRCGVCTECPFVFGSYWKIHVSSHWWVSLVLLFSIPCCQSLCSSCRYHV